MDFATRFPEARALRKADSNSIANALLDIFSRLGFPSEVLSDNGSNLKSTTMEEVYKILQIHPLRTSPYHPETNGMLERFHYTLKQMLRKVKGKFQGQWDKALPSVLFAYREVPNITTGFSPLNSCTEDISGDLWTLSEKNGRDRHRKNRV